MTFVPFPRFPRLPRRRRYSLGSQGGRWIEKGLFGRPEFVLSRPLYRFARFDLAAMAASDRASALQLQLEQWSPFLDTGYCLVWYEDVTLVWAWDADTVRSASVAQGLNPDQVQVLPESLLHPVRSDGVWLVACHDGYEGQIWQTGHLSHSRWWPEPPDEQAWLNFQRDAGLAPERQNATSLRPVEAPWQATAWARPSGLTRPGRQMQTQRLILSGIFVLTALSLWHGFAYLRAGQDLQTYRDKIAALKERAAPLLEARSQAMDAKASIVAIRALTPYVDPLTLMAATTQALPAGAYLKTWEERAGQVKFLFVGTAQPSAALFIKDLLATGWFRNVMANTGNLPNSLAVTADIIPVAEVDPAIVKKWQTGQATAQEQALQVNPPGFQPAVSPRPISTPGL